MYREKTNPSTTSSIPANTTPESTAPSSLPPDVSVAILTSFGLKNYQDQFIQQPTAPLVGLGFQVDPQILPYYSSLSAAQQNKLGTALSANASNTNGTLRQDFQNGVITVGGTTPIAFFNDGTSVELPKSLIQTLPIAGTLSATGNISSNLSSSDAKDQFRSAFIATA